MTVNLMPDWRFVPTSVFTARAGTPSLVELGQRAMTCELLRNLPMVTLVLSGSERWILTPASPGLILRKHPRACFRERGFTSQSVSLAETGPNETYVSTKLR